MLFASHWARSWEIMVNQMYPKFLPLWSLLLRLLCACLRWFRERFYYFIIWIWGVFFIFIFMGSCRITLKKYNCGRLMGEESDVGWGIVKTGLVKTGLDRPSSDGSNGITWALPVTWDGSVGRVLTYLAWIFGSKLMAPPLHCPQKGFLPICWCPTWMMGL